MQNPDSINRIDLLVGSAGSGDKLCFDKNEFMKSNFSVDEFLHKNCNVANLELLRDNLGLYLKGLRASMIDLINEDYADFVSLSANLVGLDQTIETIQQPLAQFRDEIQSIHDVIADNVSEIRAHLAQKEQLRELERNLQCLKKVYQIMDKLKHLLSTKLCPEAPLEAVVLERATLDLIQLKFNEKYCCTYLNSEQQKRITELTEQVHGKLRAFFNESLKNASSTCSEQLERCLRIYITLDACDVAERVFREDFVAPYMSGIITEQQLQNSPQGLAGIYSKILNFISMHMTDLLRLTQYSDKLHGFNFIVHSYWADVETRLEVNMSSIFAPGNSEIFYAKYKCTRDFLSKIEELLASNDEQAVLHFRQYKQTKNFQARWNLPVYFQICFQEIAGQLEANLEPLLNAESFNLNDTNKTYQLLAFNAAYRALQCCWKEGVYLVEIFPKFYKLSLQIMLRLSRWIVDVLHYLKSNTSYKENFSKTHVLIMLYADICKFESAMPELKQLILKNVPNDKRNALIDDTISRSFSDLTDDLSVHLNDIKQLLVDFLIAECGADNMRQVNDLPRLYRKTNREVPTKCSSYIEQILRPLKAFVTKYENQLGTLIIQQILGHVFNSITKDYFTIVSDVLTSVQKTEESLRRLRNIKSGSSTVPSSGSAMSDDDKIRLQLRVDVTAWTDELSKLHFLPKQVEKLLDLNKIVEDSMRLKEHF